MTLPWSDFWTHNYFAETWPALAPFVGSAYVRGGVTGLGIANLLMGISDLAGVFAARASDLPEHPGLDSGAESRIEP
jgi:hypothetical protein